jgi:hypothetical protein
VPFTVTGRGQRIDREHLVAGREQRLHPRTAVGLDPDDHRVRLAVAEMVRDQSVQHRDPATPSGSRRRASLRPSPSWISTS